jgi:lysophospholipase L1-like esterase
MRRRRIVLGCSGLLLLLLLALLALLLVAFVQGRRTPAGRAEYVALGSSFAAGAGLGALQTGSPWLCARSVAGYPQQLARSLKLGIVDMSCGGAVTRHVLDGGQYFQGPQLRAVTAETRLVTLTVGGNDILYIGDLSQLAARNSGSLYGRLVRHVWSGPRAERDFARLQRELVAVLRGIRLRAPQARTVVATYPAILPPEGTCARIGLSASEADLMRGVADRLAATTREAAKQGGAILVDMHAIGADHHACSAEPWTNGWANGGIAPFHPNMAGAKATAEAIASTLAAHQQL